MKNLCPTYLGARFHLFLFSQTPLNTVVIISQTKIDSKIINNTINTAYGPYFSSHFWVLLGRYCLSEDFDFVGMICMLIDSEFY